MRFILGNFTLPLLIFVTSGNLAVSQDGVRMVASISPLVVEQPRKIASVEKEIPVVTKPFTPTDALKDPQDKISAEFKVPESMQQRTAFWFDIYTKYGSNDHVIHHVLYPWIVFAVINTDEIDNGPGKRWTKYHKAIKKVSAEKKKLVRTLNKLAKRKSFKKLTAYEREILAKLEPIKGKRKAVLREAASNIRSQLGQKDFIAKGLETSGKYLGFMEKEFSAAGLPVELTRLPFVESSFNERAESKVGASGIWQIMPRTGKQYLIVNEHIDERNSPLKASLAAIQIFKLNYKQLGDWPLAVTAYNHGAGGVKKALRQSRSTNLPQLIDRYHRGSFKFASANFYSCFLAVLHAERYHEQIFGKPDTAKPHDPVVLQLKRSIRVRELVKKIGISQDDLLAYNYDLKDALRTNARLPKGYRILLPDDMSNSLPRIVPSGSRFFQEAALELPAMKRI